MSERDVLEPSLRKLIESPACPLSIRSEPGFLLILGPPKRARGVDHSNFWVTLPIKGLKKGPKISPGAFGARVFAYPRGGGAGEPPAPKPVSHFRKKKPVTPGGGVLAGLPWGPPQPEIFLG